MRTQEFLEVIHKFFFAKVHLVRTIGRRYGEQGFDAIIVMRLITTKSKSTYVQGGVNPAYTQNYIFYYPDYLKSGSYATDLEYIIATNFYSLTQNKLLWSGVTKSTNPEKVDKLVNEVAKEVVFKMKEDKFIPEK